MLQLPTSREEWDSFVAGRAEHSLDRAKQVVAELKDGTPRSAADVLALLNEGDIALSNASTFVSLFAEVHPDPSIRSLAETQVQLASTFGVERAQDRDLYAVLAAVDPSGLDVESQRLLSRTLRDFRRSGIDTDDATRSRVKEISDRLTVLGQDFSRNIRDDVRTIRIAPDRLAGLPQDFIDAHPAGEDGLVRITTDYPDSVPFRTFASDAAARLELQQQFLNRAWPANDALLAEILALRAEYAGLLGYDNWAEYDAEVKMIASGKAITEFIDRICELAQASAQRDVAVLLERARLDRPDLTKLTSADTAYYGELIRRENFEVDAQQVRQYFAFDAVRTGLLAVTGRLFGVQYRPVLDAQAWHEDVTAYDVLRGSEPIGRIYLDLHPRDGKFKHAACFGLVSGVSGVQLPEGALVCNFPRGLMQHTDVVTLFHEFGHLVHAILGGAQRTERFTGIATEWDFVEAPSQMLEEWAWDVAVLQTFALNEAGEAIPGELVARMRAAKDFGSGYFVRTQMFYAALSYSLHAVSTTDITAVVRELQGKYDVFGYLPETHFQASFGHLEGYTSAYYTYMWSLVIAKDLFSAFDPTDLFEPGVAGRYRDLVLTPGGTKDAAELVADFLGRPYAFDAFGRWLSGS
ncbi:MAG TPA: M3 family metallopeptidase [Jatrophihabitans sp.]|jgi:thimet oligopeptidase